MHQLRKRLNMKKVLFILIALSLSACGSSEDNSSGLNPDPTPENPLPKSGEVTSDELKNSSEKIDGYDQITVSEDSNLTLVVDDSNKFKVNKNEKMIINGQLTITSNQ